MNRKHSTENKQDQQRLGIPPYFLKWSIIKKSFEGISSPLNAKIIALRSKKESEHRKILVPRDYPVEITKKEKTSECTILEGNFTTPLELHLPGLVPKAAKQAHFQILLPNEWKDKRHKPMCIHLAGTGDHYYWRRRNFMAKPLLREAGLGAILLENPFYGVRKPKDQIRSNLHNVSDIFVMGGCLVLECLVLLHWCEKNGFGPLGVTGLSMGGHMASLAATNWPKPLVLVPCLSWSTASTVFTTGVMSQSINWDMLETQYYADGKYRERLSKMVTVIDDAFMAGQHFIKHFNQSMKALKRDIKDVRQINQETAVPQDSTHLQDTQLASTKVIKVDKNNSLDLSDSLHHKLMSNERYELTHSEINELNQKLINAQKSIANANQQTEFLLNPTAVCTEVFTGQCGDASQQAALVPKKEELSPMTKLMRYILPQSSSSTVIQEKIDITKTKWWEREALQFMRGVMDECTHLKNFSVPYDTSLIIAVCAKDDAYVPREGCSSLEDIWPGVEVRYLDAGHVSAYVLHQKLFRSSIVEAFERAKRKRDEYSNTYDEPDLTLTYEELQKTYQQNQRRLIPQDC